MSEVLSQPVVHALARALGHFVWQGAAIGLVTLVAFRLLRSSANARYLVGVTGLAAMLIAPIVTLVLLNGAESRTTVATSTAPGTAAASAGFAEQVSTAAIAAVTRPVEMDWLAIAVVAWMIGAMGFALRLAGGWIVARRYVTRAVEPASEHLVDLVHDLSTRMGIPRAIAIVQSSAVSVPVLIGWLKPTIV